MEQKNFRPVINAAFILSMAFLSAACQQNKDEPSANPAPPPVADGNQPNNPNPQTTVPASEEELALKVEDLTHLEKPLETIETSLASTAIFARRIARLTNDDSPEGLAQQIKAKASLVEGLLKTSKKTDIAFRDAVGELLDLLAASKNIINEHRSEIGNEQLVLILTSWTERFEKFIDIYMTSHPRPSSPPSTLPRNPNQPPKDPPSDNSGDTDSSSTKVTADIMESIIDHAKDFNSLLRRNMSKKEMDKYLSPLEASVTNLKNILDNGKSKSVSAVKELQKLWKNMEATNSLVRGLNRGHQEKSDQRQLKTLKRKIEKLLESAKVSLS